MACKALEAKRGVFVKKHFLPKRWRDCGKLLKAGLGLLAYLFSNISGEDFVLIISIT